MRGLISETVTGGRTWRFAAPWRGEEAEDDAASAGVGQTSFGDIWLAGPAVRPTQNRDMISADNGFSTTARLSLPPRVERVDRGWVKRAEPAGKNPWRHLVRFTTSVVPWPLLRSTATTGDSDSVQAEASRLREWHAKGLPVPQLLEVSEEFILTADAGVPLRNWLRNEPDSRRRLAAVALAARGLAQLHRMGHCHGRPFMKDILFDGDRISFIDLEEDPTRVMPLVTAQVRDLMLFVMSYTASLGRQHGFDDLRRIAEAYRDMNPSVRIQRVLRRNLRALWWASLPLRLVPCRWLGRDGRQAVLGLKVLRRLTR